MSSHSRQRGSSSNSSRGGSNPGSRGGSGESEGSSSHGERDSLEDYFTHSTAQPYKPPRVDSRLYQVAVPPLSSLRNKEKLLRRAKDDATKGEIARRRGDLRGPQTDLQWGSVWAPGKLPPSVRIPYYYLLSFSYHHHHHHQTTDHLY